MELARAPSFGATAEECQAALIEGGLWPESAYCTVRQVGARMFVEKHGAFHVLGCGFICLRGGGSATNRRTIRDSGCRTGWTSVSGLRRSCDARRRDRSADWTRGGVAVRRGGQEQDTAGHRINMVWTKADQILLNAADAMFNKPILYVKPGQAVLASPLGILQNHRQLQIFANGTSTGELSEPWERSRCD